MDEAATVTATKTTRRNGQLMSCEPCRRSKQRCDHGMPHCMRCRRRGKAAEAKCHYHPAPMTRGARAENAWLPAVGTRAPPAITNIYSSASMNGTGRNDSIDRGTSLVAMDNVLSPLLELPAIESASKRTYTAITRTGIAAPAFTASPAILAEGISVLDTLRDAPLALTRVVEQWFGAWGDESCSRPLVKVAWQAVEEALLPKLRADSSAPAVSDLCANMFECTSQPLRWPMSPADGALVTAFSAEGVRWETLGIYFAHVGAVLGPMREGDDSVVFALEKWGPDRKCAMERALDASLQCYRICERMGQINDLTVWLLDLAIMLTTWCYGDDSYQAWRLMGDLASVVVALGYHGSTNQEDSQVPLYLQQLRKRALAETHELDKGLATFVGRPPHLSRHYIGLDLPLDLSASAMMNTPAALEEAMAKLDSNGWNTEGLVHPTTRIRAVAMLIGIREEALELSLGPRDRDVNGRSHELLAKSAATWASFPPHVKYEPSAWSRHSTNNAMMLLMVRLEALYTEFILHKLVVGQDHSSRSMLIETSHLILSLLLSALSQRLVLAEHRIDLEWSLVFYAMPCASVLILELLRQAEQPPQQQQQHTTTISRSTLIQDLSVLISCCDWLTEPDQQNYSLCKRAQSIFSRSLDRILNGPAQQQPAMLPAQDELANHFENNADVPAPASQGNQAMLIDEPEWMAWLETCNLQADPWLDVLSGSAQGYPDGFQGDVQNGDAGNV